MNWWRGLLGIEKDGQTAPPEVPKNVTMTGLPSRQDGVNFRTNMVTLAQYNDAMTTGGAVGLTATWACVNLIAGAIGSLPLMVYRSENGVSVPARNHPLWYLLHDSPNFDQTSLDFWEYMAAAVELSGNAYAQIERAGDGRVLSLQPIAPEKVNVRRGPSGEIEYRWREGSGQVVRGPRDVLHVRGPMGTALGGLSALTVCRGAFDSAGAAETAASSTFANGLQPSGTLGLDDALTPEQRAELEEILGDKFAGAMNTGRPMVLDRGMKWTALNITPEDAQMLDSRKFSGEEICRVFGVPPAMVGYGDKASNWGTGKEVDVLGFLKFTLRRRVKRIEQAAAKQLLTAKDRLDGISIGFNMDALLRGDSAGRAGFYQTMTGLGAMTINEVRALENLPPVAGGDVPRMQMQNVPIGETGTENIQ